MRQDLLAYYERELTFMRQMGAEFAEKYPKIASRLMLEPDRCEDPHVERLLEAFAFLAARVHLRIDDDFPEVTSSLLELLYPHYLRPIPSMSVVQLHLDPEQAKSPTGLTVLRNSMLYSREVEGAPCKFRTCYDTALWPISVTDSGWAVPERLQVKAPDAAGAIVIHLQCLPDVTFDNLQMPSMRFYLNGDSNLVNTLYEHLCSHCTQVLLARPGKGGRTHFTPLPASVLKPVGFGENESLLPFTRRSFEGYRLLQEYFVFPEKFLFFDLSGLEVLHSSEFKEHMDIILLLSPQVMDERLHVLETGINRSTFRLGCTPIVNLFPLTAEPILFDQASYEYPVIPDSRRRYAIEIFSVDDVTGANSRTHEDIHFAPFYAHIASGISAKPQAFWKASRRTVGTRESQRTEVYLSLLDASGCPIHPETDAVTARCTCTNYTLPSRLPFGSEAGDFELEGASAVQKITVLRKPTPTLRPPTDRGSVWRLISLLSLNYLSLVDEGKESLQELLLLQNFSDSVYLQNQVRGIVDLRSSRKLARMVTENGIASVRGTLVEMQFDEEQFVGGGVYLFASVLERFLGMYVSLNSFTQLHATTLQRKEPLKKWPPRAGNLILI